MILPLVAVVRIRTLEGRHLNIWLPLFLLWLLLLPFAVVLTPVFVIVCLAVGVDPFAAIASCWRIFAAFCGTHVEVDSPNATVFVHVY
ncbi:MAG TPA: hypothetical protein VHL34_23895 [Rhizomicrobium sp.]|jgi:hypothetical protein|nr:hypothetical protein [Rhizomicrobium sp.]